MESPEICSQQNEDFLLLMLGLAIRILNNRPGLYTICSPLHPISERKPLSSNLISIKSETHTTIPNPPFPTQNQSPSTSLKLDSVI